MNGVINQGVGHRKTSAVILLSFPFVVTVDTACQEDFFSPFSWRFVIVVMPLFVADKPMFLLLWNKKMTGNVFHTEYFRNFVNHKMKSLQTYFQTWEKRH